MKCSVIGVVLLATAWGCARYPDPGLNGDHDPANPRAAEAPLPRQSSTLDVAPDSAVAPPEVGAPANRHQHGAGSVDSLPTDGAGEHHHHDESAPRSTTTQPMSFASPLPSAVDGEWFSADFLLPQSRQKEVAR